MKKEKVLITGAGTGLGKMASIELARRGHMVYATTKYENEANKLNEIASKENLNLKSFKLDILIKKDIENIKNLDFNILINNAAIGDSGSAAEVNIDRIKKVFETNVFSTLYITQVALEKLIHQKHGKIIFVSSLFGRIPFPFLSPYCASKFSNEAFATSLRKEMKKLDNTNIQVAIIEPGAYPTGFNEQNNGKKFTWMKEKSYFKYLIDDIKKEEEKVFNLLESKNYSPIIKQYIKCVENNKLKLRYTAPKYQAFFIQLGRIFGM